MTFTLEYAIECLEDGKPFKGSQGDVYIALKDAANEGNEELFENFLDSFAGWYSQTASEEDRPRAQEAAYFNSAINIQMSAAHVGDSSEDQPLKMMKEIYAKNDREFQEAQVFVI